MNPENVQSLIDFNLRAIVNACVRESFNSYSNNFINVLRDLEKLELQLKTVTEDQKSALLEKKSIKIIALIDSLTEAGDPEALKVHITPYIISAFQDPTLDLKAKINSSVMNNEDLCLERLRTIRALENPEIPLISKIANPTILNSFSRPISNPDLLRGIGMLEKGIYGNLPISRDAYEKIKPFLYKVIQTEIDIEVQIENNQVPDYGPKISASIELLDNVAIMHNAVFVNFFKGIFFDPNLNSRFFEECLGNSDLSLEALEARGTYIHNICKFCTDQEWNKFKKIVDLENLISRTREKIEKALKPNENLEISSSKTMSMEIS